MKIGCPKEIKPQEFRVGLTPAAAREAVSHGHDVLIETGAGHGSGFDDADYIAAGATIAATRGGGLCRGRHDREGEGTAGVERARCCARARFCSPTFTLPRIPSRRATC
jgi:alanine dehydrogenase